MTRTQDEAVDAVRTVKKRRHTDVKKVWTKSASGRRRLLPLRRDRLAHARPQREESPD